MTAPKSPDLPAKWTGETPIEAPKRPVEASKVVSAPIEAPKPVEPVKQVPRPIATPSILRYKSLMQITHFRSAVFREITISYADILQTLPYCPIEFTEDEFIKYYTILNGIYYFPQKRSSQQIKGVLEDLVGKSVLKVSR